MLTIASTARISPLADIEDSQRGSQIVIEDDVVIDAFVKIKPAGGSGDVLIGRGTVINSGCVLYTGNGIRIGRDVLIAANCTLAPTNHEFADPDRPIREQGFSAKSWRHRDRRRRVDRRQLCAPGRHNDRQRLRYWRRIAAARYLATFQSGTWHARASARLAGTATVNLPRTCKSTAGNMLRCAARCLLFVQPSRFSVPAASSVQHWSPGWKARDKRCTRSREPRCRHCWQARRPAGHVIDCIGLTGDFRVRPLDTAEAHVGLVARCLGELLFDSFLLLSSTRVYARATATREEVALPTLPSATVRPVQSDKAGRRGAVSWRTHVPQRAWCDCRTCMASACRRRRSWDRCCARASATGSVVLREAAASAKDYVSVAAVVRLLPAIAAGGGYRTLQPRRRQQHQPRRHRWVPATTSPVGASASRPTRQQYDTHRSTPRGSTPNSGPPAAILRPICRPC